MSAGDGLLDVAEAGVKVHRPLVEVARGDPQQPHLARPPRVMTLVGWFFIPLGPLEWRAGSNG